ncbi:MAG: cytochrome-c oxidase, cbb3-type subunit II, partial [Gammaproteobacteria bacterium]
MKSHEYIEKRLGLLGALIIVVISFGGLAEIVPLFHMSKTTTPIEGMK